MTSAWGCNAVVKRLVQAGADIEGRDNKGRSLLYLSTYNGPKAMPERLIRFGANANAYGHDGRTLLHVASLGRCEPVCYPNSQSCSKCSSKSVKEEAEMYDLCNIEESY